MKEMLIFKDAFFWKNVVLVARYCAN